MTDQLAELASNLPVGVSRTYLNIASSSISFQFEDIASRNLIEDTSIAQDKKAMRRPFLGSLRQIESMRDLVPFFSNISISSYESVYASGGNIDWEGVERNIMDDMFDGR